MVEGVRRAAGITGDDAVRKFAKGEFVFREGDLGTEMYVLHEGKVEILRTVAGEGRQIAVLEKGDFFGEMSLLEELPRNATARILEDSTLIEINGPLFDRMLRRNPEIAVRIMRKLSRRVRQTDEYLSRALNGEDPTGPLATEPGPASFPCRLRHLGSGVEYKIDLAETATVGRIDPVTGIEPHLDLSTVDTERSSSRRHAKIIRDEGEVYLVEEIGTLNGTFINGRRLRTAVPEEISDGDKLRFGLVEFVLEIGSHPA
jgi:CRP-like cAMP-binding protein